MTYIYASPPAPTPWPVIGAYKGWTLSRMDTNRCYDGCDIRCEHMKTTFIGKREGIDIPLFSDTMRGLKSKISRYENKLL